MSGALLQLVSKGGQDVWLTGNPEITFFKSIHKRHTNFGMEEIRVGFTNTPELGLKSRCYIPRHGDLVSQCTLQFKATGRLVNDGGGTPRYWNSYYPAEQAISEVKLFMGNALIDRYDQYFPRIWTEWNYEMAEKEAWSRMTNYKIARARMDTTGADNAYEDNGFSLLKYPLLFSFCRNIGKALPLIALQYADIFLEIAFSDVSVTPLGTSYANLSNVSAIKDTEMWCQYIFLDTEERQKFAHTKHDYLIEQVQRERSTINVSAGSITNIPLHFKHPCKYLMWCLNDGLYGKEDQIYGNVGFQSQNSTGGINQSLGLTYMTHPNSNINWLNLKAFGGSYYCYIPRNNTFDSGGISPYSEPEYWVSPQGNGVISSVKLIINGEDRFQERKGDSFHYNQAWNYFKTNPAPGYYAYSFALNPTQDQPSGTCNFSKLNNVTLRLVAGNGSAARNGTVLSSMVRSPPGNIEIWGVNYNVLHIESGMGNLVYND